jgi:hypothetical protein
VSGRNILDLSAGLYQGWLDVHPREKDFKRVNALVIKDLPDRSDIEHKQAHLLTLHDSRDGTLGIEVCPGTGKSHSWRSICLALLVMGCSVFIKISSRSSQIVRLYFCT